MAVDIVLKINSSPPIKGESSKVADGIDVLEWSWGLTQSASAHVSTGAGSGSADVRDLTIKKWVDGASPVLIYSCFKGNDLKEAVLTVTKVGGTGGPIEMVKMTMYGTVFVSSVNTGQAEPGDRYSETITLNFAKVKFDYTGQKADQSKGATVNSNEINIALAAH